jgi:hypothetical protein
MTYEEAKEFFGKFFIGKHHIPGKGKNKIREWGEGWYVLLYNELATFDFNYLTSLVLLAHENLYRVAVSPGNSKCLRIIINKRRSKTDKDEYWETSIHHPTSEQLIELIKKKGL